MTGTYVEAVGLLPGFEAQSGSGLLVEVAKGAGFRRLTLAEVPEQIRTALPGGYYAVGVVDGNHTVLAITSNRRGYTVAVAVRTPELVTDTASWADKVEGAFGEVSPVRLQAIEGMGGLAVDQAIVDLLAQWVNGELS